MDLIVNNAGLMQFIAIEDLTGEDWTKVLGVDCDSRLRHAGEGSSGGGLCRRDPERGTG